MEVVERQSYEILGTGNVTVFFKNDTSKKVIISGRGNYGVKPDKVKVKDAIGDIVLNSDDTVTKYNLVIECLKMVVRIQVFDNFY